MVKPMENGQLYSGLTRLKLMTKRKVGRGGPYFIENVTVYLNIRSPGTDFRCPRRAIFASGVNHSRLIDCPVG